MREWLGLAYWVVHIISYGACFLYPTEVSEQTRNGNYLSFAMLSGCHVVSLIFWCFAHFRDPGYLTADNCPLHSDAANFHCSKCDITLPYRASHCKICEKCVRRKDHHCPWVGTCIGQRNHLFFFIMIVCDCAAFGFSLWELGSFLWTHLVHWNELKSNVFLMLLIAFPIGGIAQVFPLLVTHTYLIIVNKTTWENILGRQITYLQVFPFNSSPFSKGILENVKEFLRMGFVNVEWRIPSSSDDYRAYVETNRRVPGNRERIRCMEDLMLDVIYDPTSF